MDTDNSTIMKRFGYKTDGPKFNTSTDPFSNISNLYEHLMDND